MKAEAFTASLECVARKCADLAPFIYAELFKRDPTLEEHFGLDTDGGVRGSMLQQTFDVLLDIADGTGNLAATVLSAERSNHDSYGVDGEAFDQFLPVVHDVCRTICGPDWTRDMEDAWATVIAHAKTF